jgi:hypothetical protein
MTDDAPTIDPALESADAVPSTGAAEEDPRWKRNVAVFLTGQSVSLLGSMLVQFAVMWHLTILTRSGSVLMLSIVFGMLPQAFVSIFGGVWADRHDRRLLIIGADTTIAVVTLALALLMLSGVDDLWVIYAALAVRSTFAGIQTPAVSAMIPQIVPATQLIRINGINQSIQSGMMLLAPALAAAVYANFDIVAVFFVDVVTALVGVGLLLTVRVPRLVRSDGGAPPSYFGDLAAGVRYIRSHTAVRWLMTVFAVTMLLIGVSIRPLDGGMPTQLRVPPTLSMSAACENALTLPAVTMTASAPRPPVRSTTSRTRSEVVRKSIWALVPRDLRNSILSGPPSTPMTCAPWAAAYWTTALLSDMPSRFAVDIRHYSPAKCPRPPPATR